MRQRLISITGQSGLFLVVNDRGNKLVVENISTGKRVPVLPTDSALSINDITIFCEGEENTPLTKVLNLLYQKHEGKKVVSPKDSHNKLKAFLAEVLPNYHKEKVYFSDMKKIASWYNLLSEKNLLPLEEEEEEQTEEGQTKEEQTEEEQTTTKDKTSQSSSEEENAP